jgi:hypothetical protein
MNSLKNFSKNLALVFSAGCLGGLANSLAVWLFGAIGINTAFGVKIVPHLTPLWLYPRIVWGGLWGILFLMPFLTQSYFLRGLLYGLGPTIVQLFIVFPFKANKGLLGLELSSMTPIFVLLFNSIWGVTAGLWLKLIDEIY